jgi:hypothetical protein
MGDVQEPIQVSERNTILDQSDDLMTSNRATQALNEALVRLIDHNSQNDVLHEISGRNRDIVTVWKNFTKVNGGEFQRRVENTSWRLWYQIPSL